MKGWGAKKFDTSLETREIKLFWRDIPGFCRDIPEAPEKLEKKKFVFNFRSLFLCNLIRKSPQNMEKVARFPGVESCHVSGCPWFFSVPV